MTLIAPAGIHVKGVAKGDIFMWSREELTRNLFHDPAFANAALAIPLSEAEQFNEMKNRLATAKLGWQPRLYNPDLYKWLHRVQVPTLIVFGDDDKVIPPAVWPGVSEAHFWIAARSDRGLRARAADREGAGACGDDDEVR